MRRPGQRLPTAKRDAIAAAYQAGESYAAMRERFGVSPSTVTWIARERGIFGRQRCNQHSRRPAGGGDAFKLKQKPMVQHLESPDVEDAKRILRRFWRPVYRVSGRAAAARYQVGERGIVTQDELLELAAARERRAA